MNAKKRGEIILALFFIAFFAFYVGKSMTYSPKARRMLIVVGIPGLALAAVNVLKLTARKKRSVGKGETEPLARKEEESEAQPSVTGKKKIVEMIGWMALLVFMIWMLGFLITIPLYTLLFMKSMKESWRLSILVSAAGLVALYLLFVVAINIELYPGLLFKPY